MGEIKQEKCQGLYAGGEGCSLRRSYLSKQLKEICELVMVGIYGRNSLYAGTSKCGLLSSLFYLKKSKEASVLRRISEGRAEDDRDHGGPDHIGLVSRFFLE